MWGVGGVGVGELEREGVEMLLVGETVGVGERWVNQGVRTNKKGYLVVVPEQN